MESEKHDEVEKSKEASEPNNCDVIPAKAGIQVRDGGLDSPVKPENDIYERPGESPLEELDLPPEYCRYRDEGCDLADSCLHCPFVRCVYDEPGGKRRWLKRLRAREMARLFTAEGKGIKELALIFGVSQRTVQRVLKTSMGGARGSVA